MKKNSGHQLLELLPQLVKLACLLAVVYFVVRCIDSQATDDIDIKDTPITINDIKPIGELYAYTAITEDFTIDNVEKVGFFTRKYYKAVQTLRMQVSYVMNLDSVSYQPLEGTDTVVVSLPPLRYVQTAQGGQFLCEVEVADYNARGAIGVVERKVRSKYDTAENRQKAENHVREVLTSFIEQCGKKPVFKNKQ